MSPSPSLALCTEPLSTFSQGSWSTPLGSPGLTSEVKGPGAQKLMEPWTHCVCVGPGRVILESQERWKTGR